MKRFLMMRLGDITLVWQRVVGPVPDWWVRVLNHAQIRLLGSPIGGYEPPKEMRR